MPSPLHELLVRLLRETPSLVNVLVGAQVPLPAGTSPEPLDPTFSAANAPTMHAVDLAIRYRSETGAVVLAIEVQLGRDPDKTWTWPYYVASLRARERCEVWLVVVTLESSVATWARVPIVMGHGSTFAPIVVGPDEIPVLTDVAAVRSSPELALLGVLATVRRDGDAAELAVTSLIDATKGLDPASTRFYSDVAWHEVRRYAPNLMEKLMRPPYDYQVRSEFALQLLAQGRAEGQNEGERRLVERQLERRFGPLSSSIRERLASASVDDLERWGERLLDAKTVAEVFQS